MCKKLSYIYRGTKGQQQKDITKIGVGEGGGGEGGIGGCQGTKSVLIKLIKNKTLLMPCSISQITIFLNR